MMASARATSCNAALVRARPHECNGMRLRLREWGRASAVLFASLVLSGPLPVHVVAVSTVSTSVMGDAVCAKIKQLS